MRQMNVWGRGSVACRWGAKGLGGMITPDKFVEVSDKFVGASEGANVSLSSKALSNDEEGAAVIV